jgi:hypothetical protein
MTQREFERRVKGIGKQPRRWIRREGSQPGRLRRLLRATFAMLGVAVALGLTASRIHEFPIMRPASQEPAQLTGHPAVARTAAVPAVLASAASETSRHAHFRHVSADTHRSQRHTVSAGARHNSVAAPSSARDQRARNAGGIQPVAAVAASDESAQNLGGAIIWIQSVIRSWFSPVFGSGMADSAAQRFAANFAVVAAAGAFLLVLLLVLGAGMALSSKMSREQRVEA